MVSVHELVRKSFQKVVNFSELGPGGERGMRWDGMEWDVMGCGMAWDEMRWAGMGWDGMAGWDEMRMRRRKRRRMRSGKSLYTLTPDRPPQRPHILVVV